MDHEQKPNNIHEPPNVADTLQSSAVLEVNCVHNDLTNIIKSVEDNSISITELKVLVVKTDQDDPYTNMDGTEPNEYDDGSLVDRLLSLLPCIEKASLHLCGLGVYFKQLNLETLPMLKIVNLEFELPPLHLSDGRSLFDAASNLETVEFTKCVGDGWLLRGIENLNLPNIKRFKFNNSCLFTIEMKYLGTLQKLCAFKYSFDFIMEQLYNEYREQVATPKDVLTAFEPLKHQLEELELVIGIGSPPENLQLIESLANFERLRLVSIAARFVKDLQMFIRSPPSSVNELLVHGGDSRVCQELGVSPQGSMTVKHIGCSSCQWSAEAVDV
ncbi:hypothetical protein ColTof4_01245 [Colletotrichum tofieldiae]|nr:hypothetical protein ColTof3_08484 [Colletotrichum tofieldiae]GKT68822.1 hypothetical protein ColTof4_01245 [Colletotrichum tofieldiae]